MSGTSSRQDSSCPLSDEKLERFIHDGFVKIENAFPRHLAEEAREILWQDLRKQGGCDPDDRASWIRPVIRLGMYSPRPFIDAANTPILHAAFDQLVGVDTWEPCRSMGTFPVRFPSTDDPGDVGWHVDVSFDYHLPNFLDWRANIYSKGRTLLMLFLFSDVREKDAPTRIRAGSHLDIARVLAPAGEAGLTLGELVPHFAKSERRPEILATGPAGTVYLCHPFLVHSAQLHSGSEPRFMAQPPLLPRKDRPIGLDGNPVTPIEQAVRLALG